MEFNKDTQFVSIDVETTGLDPQNDRIVEFAAVAGTIEDDIAQYDTLVSSDIPIPPRVQRIHGITNEMISDAPNFHEIVPAIESLVKDRIVIAHNVGFDLSFLKFSFHRAGTQLKVVNAVDSLKLSRLLLKGLVSYKLESVAKHLAYGDDGYHRALFDCKAVMHIFRSLYEKEPAEFLKGINKSRYFMKVIG